MEETVSRYCRTSTGRLEQPLVVWPNRFDPVVLLCESSLQRFRSPGQSLRTAADLEVPYPLLSSAVPSGDGSACGAGSWLGRRGRLVLGDHRLVGKSPKGSQQPGGETRTPLRPSPSPKV